MKTELSNRDLLIRLLAYSSIFIDEDDIPKEDISRLENAGLIIFYDNCYFISYDALELLYGTRNVPGDEE